MATGVLAAFSLETNARCPDCQAPVYRDPRWTAGIKSVDVEGAHVCGSASSQRLKAEGF